MYVFLLPLNSLYFRKFFIMIYDKNNVFAKILKKEIKSKPVFENDFVLAFFDIAPKSKIHILVIPKGNFVDFYDFHSNASTEFISEFYKSIKSIVEQFEITNNFRLLTNCGSESGQEVFHFHVHILSNK